MADTVPMVAVEATEEKYRVLKHHPSGLGLDQDGKGTWPADSFTYRLVAEKSIRIVAAEAQADATAPSAAAAPAVPPAAPLPPADAAVPPAPPAPPAPSNDKPQRKRS